MPKVSKIAPPKKSIDFKPVYRCKKCKKEFTESQRAKAFSRGSSPLWQGDGKFFPVCKDCVDELYNHGCVYTLMFTGLLKYTLC